MNQIAERIVCGLVACLVATAGILYVRSLHSELETAHTALTTATQGIADRDDTILEMQRYQRQNEAARAKLEDERTGIKTALFNRETLIRNLENENAELRAWSAVALPDAVIRLREHAPQTGATAYRESVRERDALHPAGDVASH